MRVEGDTLPEAGAAVTRNGEVVGEVRSMAQSPTYDMAIIAAAAVDRELSGEGTELDVAIGDGSARATVTSFPLYDPEKKRPRA